MNEKSQGTGTARAQKRGNMYFGVAGGLLALAGGLAAGHFVFSKDARAATSSPRTGAAEPGSAAAPVAPAPASDDPATRALAQQVGERLGKNLTVHAGKTDVVVRWSDLGAVIDQEDLPFAARRAGGADALAALVTAGALPVRIDRDAGLAALTKLKGTLDRAPTDARMDLEARTIRDDEPGTGLDVYASLAALEAAARTGADEVALQMVPLPARVTRQTLGIDDISHVLGTWTTHFSVSDKDRNFNLKLAASKLNGHVIPAHGEFSFNDTVGERSEREGYKIAHVIQAGEMVDGLAGGTCQISTTLFGASFFAGLDIDHVSNHSRPSAYQPIGFDATVVWPATDLKMTNSYDFPVVIHYRVASGEAFVEILGKQRPYDQVAFEREILEQTPFTSEDRPDETMPEGAEVIDQPGFDGYKITRFRKFFKKGKLVKTEHWTVNYKPVTEFVRKGTSTDPEAKMPPEKEVHGPKAPKDGSGRIVQ